MTIVTTSYGDLRGVEEDGVAVIRGVPFAKPPVGPLRFRAPERAEGWSGVRDAARFGPAALQAESPPAAVLGLIFEETSEDCLYLNVWTPSAAPEDGGGRPVMVWVHGGAWVIGAGSDPSTDGARLAGRGDVVVVTVNYRVGIFGYLRGREATNGVLDTTGNEAMLDIIAALEWVRDEIAHFGGDPANVTLFGESAGSVNTACLLTSSRARGLFHKAILQSGSLNLVQTPENATAVMGKILDDLGLAPSEAGQLRELPAERLMMAQNRATPRAAGVSYAPVADGEVIPMRPFEALAGGCAAGVPVLAGTNLEEMKLYTFMDPAITTLDEAGLLTRCRAILPATGGVTAEDLIETYRIGRIEREEPVTPAELWLAISTDQVFRAGAMRLAELQAKHSARTYAYLFGWKAAGPDGPRGAVHALDLPFVFGTLNSSQLGRMAGPGAAAEMLSARMQDAWASFAHDGCPRAEGLPAWEGYAPPRRATMLLDAEPRLVDAPLERERAAWDPLW